MARKPSPGANLARIAESLGISVSTASRAIRNADGIHPETRRRVLEKAGEMGYVLPGLQGPDIKARPHQILALATSSAPGSDQGFLTGMSRASIAMNLAVLSHHVQPNDYDSVLDHERQPVAMRAGMVDGVVLIHYWPNEVAIKIAERYPTVSIAYEYSHPNMDRVGVNDLQSSRHLLEHFLKFGHSKVGFFGFCPKVSWSRSRLASFFEAQLEQGLSYEPQNIVSISLPQALSQAEFEDDGWGNKAMTRIKKGVDAWICSSAGTATTLLNFLSRKGLKIPRDVSIASSSGRYADRLELPELTMMHVPSEELGAAALRRLVHRLQSPRDFGRTVLLPQEFIVGQTSRQVSRKKL